MKTNYLLHDQRYRRLRQEGTSPGWDDARTLAENLALWKRRLAAEYLPQSGRVLEMGCGAGNLTNFMAAQGWEAHGIDIAPAAIEWARENAKQAGVCSSFRVGSVTDLSDFADDTFDLVLDGHCFHCIIGEDRPHFLAEAYRVLRPGGFLLILTMTPPDQADWSRLNYDSQSRCQIVNGDALRYFVGTDELLAELTASGFSVRAHAPVPRTEPEGSDRVWTAAEKP